MADINFSCPSCNQLLTADDSLIGQEIACPSCNETIIVQDQTGMGGGGGSAMRLSVPTGAASESLIQKPAKPLDAAAKAAIKVCCRTFRHHEHLADGKDKFDEAVSRFLAGVGEENVVSVESIQYTRVEKDMPMTDYGAMIIYKSL